jgi:hypothetical protein
VPSLSWQRRFEKGAGDKFADPITVCFEFRILDFSSAGNQKCAKPQGKSCRDSDHRGASGPMIRELLHKNGIDWQRDATIQVMESLKGVNS